MAAFEVIALDTATPQLRAPGASDTYTFPRAVEMPLGTANGVLYLNGSKVVTSGSALVFDSSGNLGLGVTPSASNLPTIESEYGLISGEDEVNIIQSAYYNSGFKYSKAEAAGRYLINSGIHSWHTSTDLTPTAGNPISFSQVMTLDASGNLGLGTTALNNYGNTTTFTIGNSVNAARIDFKSGSTTTAYVSSDSGNALYFGANGSERARITSGGDLLVGKAAVDAAVVGVQLLPSGGVTTTRSGSTNATSTMEVYSTGASAYRFYVAMDGTVAATNTTISAISDQRFKENVRDLDVGLNAIMALKPRKFDWKAGKGKDIKDDRGFIAQEFEQVFPDLIDEWKDPAPEGEEPYKSVRQDLIPVLVKAIQEQQALITALTARVTALEIN